MPIRFAFFGSGKAATLKSLGISPIMATMGRSTSITLTVLFAMNAATPNFAHAIWPFSSKGPSISAKQNGKVRVFTLKQGTNPPMMFIEDGNSGHLLVRRTGSNDIDTGFGKIISIGLPAGMTLSNEKKDIPTYEVKSEGRSQMIVVNTADGTILINRVEHNYFYDHVLVLGKGQQIASQKTEIVDHQNANGSDAPSTITTTITATDGRARKFTYQSEFKAVMEKAPIPSTQQNLDNLRAAITESQNLAKKVKEKIFGQDHAIDRTIHYILAAKTNPRKKPYVLELVGPSGAGKTFLLQTIAEEIYGENAGKMVLEIKGSDYSNGKNSLDDSKLFGTAKSVENATKGRIVEWLEKTNGEGILVINEWDKMHADVKLKFMEFFDRGEVTDWEGKTIKAKNVLIALTSNRGAKRMYPDTSKNLTQDQADKRTKGFTQEELRDNHTRKEGSGDKPMSPEEVSRIDEFIAFSPITMESAQKMAVREARLTTEKYMDENGVEFKLDNGLINYLAVTNFSGNARDVNIRVSNTLAQMMTSGLQQLDYQSGDVVHVNLSETDKREKILVASCNDKTMTLPLPKEKVENPLHDEVLLGRLKNLNANMKKEVIGQDEAIDQISQAVSSYELRAIKDRPFSALLLGPSGNGKTETARALAKAMGLSLTLISMGEMQEMSHLDALFGYSQKYNGGDEEAIFDRAIRENPEGGVIVLDEFSNMGSGNPALKAAMMKRFYTMLENGVYHSAKDNRDYDISKFKFILTGNDGEEVFRGLTADDMLLETWKENKEPAKVREMSRQAGFTNAFLNRLVNILFMKPLLSYEVRPVSEKLWQREVEAFEKLNPGVKVTVADGFMEKLGRAFFSADQGARAVRAVFEKSVGLVMGGSLVASGLDTARMQNVRLVVDIEDNFVTKNYLTATPPKRKVNFISHVYQNNQYLNSESVEMTSDAIVQVLMNSKMARAVAYHEAGHAMVNDPSITGEKTEYVTIRGGKSKEGEYLGYARAKQIPGFQKAYDRDRAMAMVARLWAGRKAQEMAGFNADAGWSNDLMKIRQILTTYLTKWGLDRELIALPVDDKGEPQVTGPAAELFRARMQQMIDEGEQMATQMLQARWRSVRAMAAELLLHGEIREQKVDEIYSRLVTTKDVTLKNYDWDYLKYKNRGVQKLRCSMVHLH